MFSLNLCSFAQWQIYTVGIELILPAGDLALHCFFKKKKIEMSVKIKKETIMKSFKYIPI